MQGNTFHAARHASLALAVLSREPGPERAACPLDGLVSKPARASASRRQPRLGQTSWHRSRSTDIDDVLAGTRRPAGPAIDLDAVPDTGGALIRAGIAPGEFGWLHRMWQGTPAAWLVRWPLLGHVGSHAGEMIATRNRMGLSPFQGSFQLKLSGVLNAAPARAVRAAGRACRAAWWRVAWSRC